MKETCGIGLCVDSARFIPANLLFRNGNVSDERTVSCYELVLFLKDGGAAVINGKKYPILAGSVRFHRPGDRVYSYRFQEIYVVHFTAENGGASKSAFAELPPFIHLPSMDVEAEIFRNMIAGFLSKNDFDCTAHLWHLLLRIKKYARAAGGRKDDTVTAILRHIEAHFTEKITLGGLADAFHLHPIYLQRLFKERTGLSPLEYTQKLRVERAGVYLVSSNMSVDEIAEAVGFCNASYFIKVFHSITSNTPAQYRKKAYLPPELI